MCRSCGGEVRLVVGQRYKDYDGDTVEITKMLSPTQYQGRYIDGRAKGADCIWYQGGDYLPQGGFHKMNLHTRIRAPLSVEVGDTVVLRDGRKVDITKIEPRKGPNDFESYVIHGKNHPGQRALGVDFGYGEKWTADGRFLNHREEDTRDIVRVLPKPIKVAYFPFNRGAIRMMAPKPLTRVSLKRYVLVLRLKKTGEVIMSQQTFDSEAQGRSHYAGTPFEVLKAVEVKVEELMSLPN